LCELKEFKAIEAILKKIKDKKLQLKLENLEENYVRNSLCDKYE